MVRRTWALVGNLFFPDSLRRNLAAAFFLMLAYGCMPTDAQDQPGQNQAPRLITSPIDNTSRVTIASSTHPKAQTRFDRGPIDPNVPLERMILVLGASADQEHQARTLLDSQQTQGSPDYHRWLTPEQFGQRFGPSPQDVQQVTSWLMQQGFRVNSVAKSARWIEFSGNAAQVQAAFRTEIHNYLVEGQLHTANASEVSIPAALAPMVRGVLSLHDFYSKPMIVRSAPESHGDAGQRPAVLYL